MRSWRAEIFLVATPKVLLTNAAFRRIFQSEQEKKTYRQTTPGKYGKEALG
jgi:hypothetical protein